MVISLSCKALTHGEICAHPAEVYGAHPRGGVTVTRRHRGFTRIRPSPRDGWRPPIAPSCHQGGPSGQPWRNDVVSTAEPDRGRVSSRHADREVDRPGKAQRAVDGHAPVKRTGSSSSPARSRAVDTRAPRVHHIHQTHHLPTGLTKEVFRERGVKQNSDTRDRRQHSTGHWPVTGLSTVAGRFFCSGATFLPIDLRPIHPLSSSDKAP